MISSGLKNKFPILLTHADWSTHPDKRRMARAVYSKSGGWLAHAPEPVGEPETLLQRLRQDAGLRSALIAGFDFPIGLPLSYAQKCGIDDFLALLPKFGHGIWRDFYRVADSPEEIHLHRPFYPMRPGQTRQKHLLDGLNVRDMDALRRICDRARPDRRAAAPLFWTMGGQQVGKAAISGWRDMLAPALRKNPRKLSIWPFSGSFFESIQPGKTLVAETYPAEVYRHLDAKFPPPKERLAQLEGNIETGAQKGLGKRSPLARMANAPALLAWADEAQVRLTSELRELISRGFGASAAGEDDFDAVVGMFGMINLLLGRRAVGEPQDPSIRNVEGWILGQSLTEFPDKSC